MIGRINISDLDPNYIAVTVGQSDDDLELAKHIFAI